MSDLELPFALESVGRVAKSDGTSSRTVSSSWSSVNVMRWIDGGRALSDISALIGPFTAAADVDDVDGAGLVGNDDMSVCDLDGSIPRRSRLVCVRNSTVFVDS